MAEIIRVAILDDHPAIVDAYQNYVQHESDIRVVATGAAGEDLPVLLTEHSPIHVLILDVEVPTSRTNRSLYPMLSISRSCGSNIRTKHPGDLYARGARPDQSNHRRGG